MSVGIPHPVLQAVNSNKTFIIGVAGGTSSGKTSVCQKILELLGEASATNGSRKVAIISQDNFYKELTKDEINLANNSQYDFDHPDAFDTKLMKATILDVAKGKTIKIPDYDFKTHTRRKDVYEELHRCDVVLFEGILVFYHKEIRNLFNMKLFVDSDADTRLSRRVLRDTTDRGRTLESVLQQYTTFVKPAFEEFCLPTKKYADVIIPRGAENFVAINLIVHHIRDIMARGHHDGDSPASQRNGYGGEQPLVNGDHVTNGGGGDMKARLKRGSVSDLVSRPH